MPMRVSQTARNRELVRPKDGQSIASSMGEMPKSTSIKVQREKNGVFPPVLCTRSFWVRAVSDACV